MFVDGSSNGRGSCPALILENEVGIVIKVSLCFEFSITNNQIEYKSFIFSLTLAAKMGR